jgi:hypothetical protein
MKKADIIIKTIMQIGLGVLMISSMTLYSQTKNPLLNI